MAPMSRYRSPGGVPSDQMAGYYARRADGGVGLIFTEGVGIDHPAALGDAGLGETDVPVLHGADALAAWRNIVAQVHRRGGKIVPQLWHQGPMRLDGSGPHPEAASMRPSGEWGEPGETTLQPNQIDALRVPTRPMRDSEVADVIEGYARSARNAAAAGFDGIALHGAHGYLIDAFLWDSTNRRTDQWGGDHRDRATFAVEVVRAVRSAIGPDLPIFFRFSQWKLQDYTARIAHTPLELEQILAPLAAAGVDVFDASTRRFDLPAFAGSDMTLAGWARKVTGRKSMAVGQVGLSHDLHAARSRGGADSRDLSNVIARFERGEFDLVGVGRALLQDPEWLVKARAGVSSDAFDQASLRILT